jgi:hypothetical protein
LTGSDSETKRGRMERDPRVYGSLLERAVGETYEQTLGQMESALLYTVHKLKPDLQEVLRHAYVEGVRDGYTQATIDREEAELVVGPEPKKDA